MSADLQPSSTTNRRRLLWAATIGTFVEYYDFGIYAFLAPVIATLFFAPGDETAAILLTLGALAAGYLVKPLGAVIFAPLADRFGRRPVLVFVIVLMTLATAGVGLLPTYSQIGVLAPILLTLLRLIQGMSSAGEYGTAATLLAETAPEGRRGFYVGFLSMAIGLAAIVASIVASVLNSADPDFVREWGWRLAFLAALPLGLIGLYIRSKVEESPEFVELENADDVSKAPLRTTVRRDFRSVARGVGLGACFAVTFATVVLFMPSYLTTFADYEGGTAQRVILIVTITYTASILPFAYLTDRVGRRPQFIGGAALVVVLAYPVFLVVDSGNAIAATVALSAMAALAGAISATLSPLLAELFATDTRATGLSLGFQISATLFSGPTPLIMAALANAAMWLPPLYVIALSALSLVALIGVKETAGRRLAQVTTA